jgi:hypothetical protein
MMLTVDDSADGEVVEDLGAVLPGVGVAVLSVDLIVEAVDGGDLSRFVVASEEGDSFGVFDLEAEEVFEGFDRVVAAINKIPDEDVARLVDFSACVGEGVPVLNS